MSQLGELASVLRSKNAGPFLVTIDILFDEVREYDRVLRSQALTPEALAPRLCLPESDVEVIQFPVAKAIKITLPRIHSAGSPFDTDVYGAQQHAPLLDIEIP